MKPPAKFGLMFFGQAKKRQKGIMPAFALRTGQ
jgi:hypothetical protein